MVFSVIFFWKLFKLKGQENFLYLSAQKNISLMRPVVFRHPISQILAFSGVDK